MERIVVGVDGSEGSQRALEWAVEEARLRHAAVEAVYAWHQVGVAPTTIFGEADHFAARARELLDGAVAGVDTTGVEVDCCVRTGSPAPALLHESKGAALLVVGARGRGGFAGLLLGSVGQEIAHHARCPVVIIPTESEN